MRYMSTSTRYGRSGAEATLDLPESDREWGLVVTSVAVAVLQIGRIICGFRRLLLCTRGSQS